VVAAHQPGFHRVVGGRHLSPGRQAGFASAGMAANWAES
jgi:hypothetical protein